MSLTPESIQLLIKTMVTVAVPIVFLLGTAAGIAAVIRQIGKG